MVEIGDQADPVFLERVAAAHGPFDLIVDDGQFRAGLGQFQHGEKEVLAMQSIDPAGAQDQVNAADGGDGDAGGDGVLRAFGAIRIAFGMGADRKSVV